MNHAARLYNATTHFCVCRLNNLSLILLSTLVMYSGQIYANRAPVVSLLENRQKNVVMQQWDLSCGAAALTTLLNFQHGFQLTEKEVALELVNRPEYIENPELLKIKEGFSLLDLKRFVERRGYRGEGFGQLTLENLLDMAPLIIPVEIDGYNHFVVFRGKAGNRILVADPAWGNRTLMVDTFMDAWIKFPEFGRVGFSVSRPDTIADLASNLLIPNDLDFVMLR